MNTAIFLLSNAAEQHMQLQTQTAENISNSQVLGYKANRSSAQPVYLNGDGLTTKVYMEENGHSQDMTDGALDYTGNNLDIALRGNVWLGVMGEAGVAYVHSASLKINTNGNLVTEMGWPVSNKNGGLINLRSTENVAVMPDGELFSHSPLGAITSEGRLPLYKLDYSKAIRGPDGMITVDDASSQELEKGVLVPGAVERTNYSQSQALIDMMESKENYSAAMKAFGSFKEITTKTTDTLMR